jgi:hypothetical protein
MLISPSEGEITGEPGPDMAVDRCTLENFLRAAADWRADALHSESMTWLYLVGLGFEVSGEQVFLLEDFGDGVGALLRNAISVNNLVNGMAPSRERRGTARTQWYFLDLRRARPHEINELQWQNTTATFDADLPRIDDREAAIFYATEPGHEAYSRTSLFSDALLECLEGEAAVLFEDRWCVTSTSLARALNRVLERKFKELAPDFAQQNVTVAGSIRNGIICYLEGPPLVDTSVEVDPPEAAEFSQIEVRSDFDKLVLAFGQADPYPFRARLMAGIYEVRAVVAPTDLRYSSAARLVIIAPPHASLKINVAQKAAGSG